MSLFLQPKGHRGAFMAKPNVLGMCERIRASAGVERPADGDSASLHTSATQPQQHLQSGDAGAGTQAEIHQPIDAPPHPTSEAGTKDAG